MEIEKTILLIEKTLGTCGDFRFDKIKKYLKLALQEANRIKEKKQKQKIKNDLFNKNQNQITNYNAKTAIKNIEDMIEKESIKIRDNGKNNIIID